MAIATGLVVSDGEVSRQNPTMESERPKTSIQPPSAVPLVLVVLAVVAAIGIGAVATSGIDTANGITEQQGVVLGVGIGTLGKPEKE